MNSLADQTILITGASSGFGRGIALACAEAGAHVALLARRRELLEEVAAAARVHGVRAGVFPYDVGNEEEIDRAVEAVTQEMGAVDVLVNNAGTNVTERSIADTSSEQWRLLLEVNLTSAFLLTKALLPSMIRRGQGTIINVASRAGQHPSLMAGVGYSTSKIGMDALTQVTNQEGNPHGVRATLIRPGEGNTPILDRRAAPPPADARERMIQPADLGAVVVLVAALPPVVTVECVDIRPTGQS